MNKRIKIVRGKRSYLYDAESVLIVKHNGVDCEYTFNTETKRLDVFDTYKTQQEYMFGREYWVYYLVDKQILREEQIKKLLDEKLS